MKRAALPKRAFQPNSSTHERNQSGADGQAQTRAAMVSRCAAIGLRKRFEDKRVFVGGYTNTGVGHAEMQSDFRTAVRHHLYSDDHFSEGGKLDGVSHKVYHHLA
jgi:hypothetical protein